MIRRLVLENWRSHEHSEFVFSRGTNVLIGRMGAGKSSVMDAVSFALFGTFPNLQTRKIKLDDCIMNKPVQKDRARVELEIEVGGSVYIIRREITLGKGTTHAEVIKDGELLEGGNTSRVNDIIVGVLGINYELFSRAIYSEQNQIDYFLQIPKGKRREKIDELLGIDKFEDARKNIVSLKNRVKDRLEDKRADLSSLEKEDLDKKLEEIRREVEVIHREIDKAKSELVVLREKYSVKKAKLDELEKAKAQLEKIKAEKESVLGRLKVLGDRVTQYTEKYGKYLEMDLEAKLEIAKKKFEELKSRKQDLEKELNSVAEKIADISAREKRVRSIEEKIKLDKSTLDELEVRLKEKETVQKNIESMRNELEGIRKRIAENETVIKTLEERENKLSVAEGKCPLCGQPLEEHKKEEIILHIKADRDGLISELKTLKDKEKNLELEIENLRKKQRELDVAEGRRDNILHEIHTLENELEELAKSIGDKDALEIKRKDLREKLEELNSLLEKVVGNIPKLERLIEIKSEIEKSKEEVEQLKEKLASLEMKEKSIVFDREGYELIREEILKITSDVSKLESDISGKQNLANEKEKLLKEIESKKEFMVNIQKEIESLKQTMDNLDILLAAFETSQAMLREEFISAVNAALADIWPRLYPYADYKNLRIYVDGKDYILQLQRRDDNWVNVEGVVSGGERSTAALALRVAFALVLTQNLSWLILDEPTHNLDKEGVQTLAKTLKEHLPSLVSQIFIITHDEDMENAVSGTLYKLERDKGVDEPTRAVLLSSGGE